MAFTAVFDACVLYPAPLRDVLMHLARTGLFRARRTDRIHDEWIGAIVRTRPDLAERLQRTRGKMDRAVPDSLVTGYEGLVPGLSLPDPDDRHVLAAAVKGRADVVVTFNLRDLASGALRGFGIEAQHPDVFIRRVLGLDEAVAIPAVRNCRATLRNPPKTVDEHRQTLSRQGLPETVAGRPRPSYRPA